MPRKQNNAPSHGDRFTKLTFVLIETPAWRALSNHARYLYLILKFEWKGPKANNNGKIALSVRQAADKLGVSLDTASRAFHDLQAKGFIVVTEIGHPGVHGSASGHRYEITELPLPPEKGTAGRRLYLGWKKNADFEVIKAKAHNPTGRNGRSGTRTRYPGSPVMLVGTDRHEATKKAG